MIHLIINAGVVINRVTGEKPEGYPFASHTWLAAEGDLAHVQRGWIDQGDGTFAPPPPDETEDQPAE